MKRINTKTNWDIVKAYINDNPYKMSGMTMLMEGWDCKENNGEMTNTSEYQFELDEIIFNEILEFMEEMATSVVLQIMHHEKFIQSAVAINKTPLPVKSFIQIQKQIREYMDQQLARDEFERHNFEAIFIDDYIFNEPFEEEQPVDGELIPYKKATGF